MSDDEKFFFKGSADKKGIDYYNRMTYNDIIACGFDPDRTLIFSIPLPYVWSGFILKCCEDGAVNNLELVKGNLWIGSEQ